MSNIRDSNSSVTIRELSLDLEEIHINEGNDLITYNPHELPSSLIVACLPVCVFTELEKKPWFRASGKEEEEHLHPPPLEKQFLISPPSSPPPGWSQGPEATPKLNFDLLSAIAAMEPGEVHELFHPEKSSQPSITVEVVEDAFQGPKPQIVHTRRPNAESS